MAATTTRIILSSIYIYGGYREREEAWGGNRGCTVGWIFEDFNGERGESNEAFEGEGRNRDVGYGFWRVNQRELLDLKEGFEDLRMEQERKRRNMMVKMVCE
ncbi:uncharacterized protein G2W53_004952 [Senna tora]|uniref:Uncharacterized protein n=1 Tax=Senna tora TaxID=362788 RepID=A0A835CHN5_9FABA|nr:uncharacterized protein G2W53_004952 [Senna tora]